MEEVLKRFVSRCFSPMISPTIPLHHFPLQHLIPLFLPIASPTTSTPPISLPMFPTNFFLAVTPNNILVFPLATSYTISLHHFSLQHDMLPFPTVTSSTDSPLHHFLLQCLTLPFPPKTSPTVRGKLPLQGTMLQSIILYHSTASPPTRCSTFHGDIAP